MSMNDEKSFLEEAKEAYFRNDEGLGQIQQPSEILEIVEDSEAYAVFLNTNGVLAVYRDAGRGEPERADYVPEQFREDEVDS